MARPSAPLTPAQRREARRLRLLGTSWREVGRLVGRDHRTVRRYVEGDQVPAAAVAAALIPVQREPEPVITNVYSRAVLAVLRHVREHGCCLCGEVAPAPPAMPLDVVAHSPCTGLVVATPGGL